VLPGVLSSQQKRMEREKMKKMLIAEINRLLKESNDEELIQLIYWLLLKSADK
jgi:hypothetical protein